MQNGAASFVLVKLIVLIYVRIYQYRSFKCVIFLILRIHQNVLSIFSLVALVHACDTRVNLKKIFFKEYI